VGGPLDYYYLRVRSLRIPLATVFAGYLCTMASWDSVLLLISIRHYRFNELNI
jgi:hypothetical protein